MKITHKILAVVLLSVFFAGCGKVKLADVSWGKSELRNSRNVTFTLINKKSASVTAVIGIEAYVLNDKSAYSSVGSKQVEIKLTPKEKRSVLENISVVSQGVSKIEVKLLEVLN